jgi:hypothetical protein
MTPITSRHRGKAVIRTVKLFAASMFSAAFIATLVAVPAEARVDGGSGGGGSGSGGGGLGCAYVRAGGPCR